MVVERSRHRAVEPAIVAGPGRKLNLFCSGFDIGSEVDVVIAGRLDRSVALFVRAWRRRFHSTLLF